jgi:hypothetical protein
VIVFALDARVSESWQLSVGLASIMSCIYSCNCSNRLSGVLAWNELELTWPAVPLQPP